MVHRTNLALLLLAPLPSLWAVVHLRRADVCPVTSTLAWDSPDLSLSLEQRLCALYLHHPLAFLNLLFFLNVDIGFWLVSLAQGSTWLIDPYWTLIPPLFAHFFASHPLAEALPLRQTAALLLVWLWSVRLTHSYFRREKWELGRREDWRFADMRTRWHRSWWVVQFVACYLVQHVLLVGLSLPFYAISFSRAPWRALDAVAVVLCVVAVVAAYFADTQLHVYMQRAVRKRPLVLDTGLWHFSRHPNHFFEQAWWWGLATLASASAPAVLGPVWVFGGAVINSLLMLPVSQMVEERMLSKSERARAYRAYQRCTSLWVPLPPRRAD